MSGHTPGPWSHLLADDSLDDAVHSQNSKAGVGDIVCLSPEHGGFDKSAARWEANARLIAAAPELLEALRAIRATCRQAINSRDWTVDGACDPDMDFRRADAAIAKATGDNA